MAKKKIFIIDDEADITLLLKYSFESKGYSVETASDGVEALQKLNTFNPDLIILDINMPRMGGIEFYTRICDSNNHPQYPVFIITAHANMEQMLKKFNIEGFMPKPFEVFNLIKETEIILKKHEQKTDETTITTSRALKLKTILIADHRKEELKKIALVFLEAGYIVQIADSGAAAIERIFSSVPDFALLNLKLKDISGDIVAAKIKQMAKTSHIDTVIYSSKNETEKSGTVKKSKINKIADYDQPDELVALIDKTLKNKS
ncbi:MAG: response regulator [Candidatus Omnitrophica bacterium]|nr:response regulator [Candidatus Omnitrophota bacterium]